MASAIEQQRKPKWPDCPVSIPVALLLGSVLRIAFLAARPLNVDEGWTMLVALSDLNLIEVTSFETSVDPHPLLFYAMYRQLAPWITSADWLFRIPVCMFSVCSVFAFQRLMRVTDLEPEVKKWSLLLFAVLPVNIHYAYDARAYSMAQLAAILVLLSYFWLRHCDSWLRMGAHAVCVGISCTFDVIGGVAVAAIVLHQCLDIRRSWKSLVATLAGITASLAYYWVRFSQLSTVGTSDQVQQPFHAGVLLDGLMQLTPFGIGQAHAASLPGGPWIYAGLSIVTLLILARALSETWRSRSSANAVFWLVVLLPFLGQLGLAMIDGGFRLHRRYLLVLVPGLVPVFTTGVLVLLSDVGRWSSIDGEVKQQSQPWIWFVGCGLLGLVPVVVSVGMQQRLGSRSDWRSLYAQIQQEIQPADGFVHPYASPAPGFVIGPLLAYAQMSETHISTDAILSPRVSLSNPRREVAIEDPSAWATDEDRQSVQAFLHSRRGHRVWSFSTPVTQNRFIDLSPHGQLIETWRAHQVEARLYQIRSD